MMGLPDRLEPWARRFQRAPAPAPADDAGGREPAPAPRSDDAAPPVAPVHRTGRFIRRALQDREP